MNAGVSLALPVLTVTMPRTVALLGPGPTSAEYLTRLHSGVTSGQLKLLAKRLMHPDDVELASLADDRFVCGSLVPDELETVFDDGTFSVRRPAGPTFPTVDQHHGAPGLAQALLRLTTALSEGRELRAKFKLFNIDASEENFTTRQFLETSTHGDDRGASMNATWLCRWSYPGDGSPAEPQLLSIVLEAYELIAIGATGGQLFADCTASAIGHNDSYRDQVLPGIDHWLARISRIHNMAIHGHHGVSLGDVNGDGLEDLYVCGAGGLPNRLYVQHPDGTATDVSVAAGVDWLDYSSAVLLNDLDNDGDQDLAVAMIGRVLLAVSSPRGRAAHRRLRLRMTCWSPAIRQRHFRPPRLVHK